MRIKKRFFARGIASLALLFCFSVCVHAQTPATASSAEARVAHYLDSVRQQPLVLQAFLREMPKGGDLHNHYAGSAYAESFIDYAVHDGFCVDRKSMSFVPPPCDAVAGRVPASDALRDPVFYGALIDAFSMRNWNPARDSGHDHFFATFLKFEPVIAAHRGEIVANLASLAAAENVQYLELLTDMGEQTAIALGAKIPWDDDLRQASAEIPDRRDGRGACGYAPQHRSGGSGPSFEVALQHSTAGCRLPDHCSLSVSGAARVFARAGVSRNCSKVSNWRSWTHAWSA